MSVDGCSASSVVGDAAQPNEKDTSQTEDILVGEIVSNESLKREMVPLYGFNCNEIFDLITEPNVEEIDEDLSIVIKPNSAFPKPWNCTQGGLVKRENDVLSGNIPFNNEVRVFLDIIFKCVQKLKQIIFNIYRKDIVFTKWEIVALKCWMMLHSHCLHGTMIMKKRRLLLISVLFTFFC